MYDHSFKNEFNLLVNEISFSNERMSSKTRFEKEAKGNSQLAYSQRCHDVFHQSGTEYRNFCCCCCWFVLVFLCVRACVCVCFSIFL